MFSKKLEIAFPFQQVYNCATLLTGFDINIKSSKNFLMKYVYYVFEYGQGGNEIVCKGSPE